MTEYSFKTDCLYFTGFKPCDFHKLDKRSCSDCQDYAAIKHRILIIKTGAAGDVIRTTPILRKLREQYSNSEITWITLYTEFIPTEAVNQVLYFNWENCLSLKGQKFNLVINLDKSGPECKLVEMVNAEEIWGFVSDAYGKVLPSNPNATAKWLTGISDNEMKNNTMHFVEENFEVCGWKFNGESYWIDKVPHVQFPGIHKSHKRIGINSGCGSRWPTRLWPASHISALCIMLQKKGYDVVLLGGPDEHQKNLKISTETGAKYLGVLPLRSFTSLVNQCDAVVTSVTMALHIAIALNKKILLLNNIFPTNEFHLYGLGTILEPEIPCKACYKNKFDSSCAQNDCMGLVPPQQVFESLVKLLPT